MAYTAAEPMPGRLRLLVGLCLSIFGIAFEMIGIATALPIVMERFEATDLYAWAFSTFVIGQLLATIIAGRVTDRHGPLRVMVFGFVVFMAGLSLGTVAPTVWILLVARLIQGVGAGGLTLSMFVTIALVCFGPERANVLGALSFVWLLPAFLGPPLAAWLTTISWRWVFAVMMPLILVAGVLTLPSMRRVQARFEPGVEHERVALWAVVAVSFSPAFIQLAGQGLGPWSALAGVLGVAGLVVGLPRVLPAAARNLVRGLGAVVGSRALAAGCFFAAEAFVLLALRELRGLEAFEAGLALTIGSLGWTAGSWAQSRPWLRLRRDQIITLGAALISAGMLTMTGFIAFELPLVLGVLGWIGAGLGMGILMPSAAVATMDLSSAQEQGRNNSALQLAEGLGNALLTGIAGAIYAGLLRNEPPQQSFVAVFGVLVAASLLALVFSRRIGPIENASLAGPPKTTA